ncbi:hypothetical protein VPHD148_0063 [Vibrio phage D148]
MARLSDLTSDYTKSGGIIDRQQIVGVGGETRFTVSFIDGAEEVYREGFRLLKGAAQDYVTGTDSNGTYIELNTPLEAGDELLLIGRSNTNEIPFTRAVSESVTLSNGQLDVDFSSIETDGMEVYVSGPLVDRGRLSSPDDFEIVSLTRITLKHSYPSGTILEGVQSARLAWVDPDNMIVNDGTKSKSLSARFRDTQESVPYFIQTNGINLENLLVGTQLKKELIDIDGIPYEDTTGYYPVLRLSNSYWDPQISDTSLTYAVVRWDIQGQKMTITATDTTYGQTHQLTYVRRVHLGSQGDAQADYGLVTENIFDQFDDGGLS